jgi:hypothetical protein
MPSSGGSGLLMSICSLAAITSLFDVIVPLVTLLLFLDDGESELDEMDTVLASSRSPTRANSAWRARRSRSRSRSTSRVSTEEGRTGGTETEEEAARSTEGRFSIDEGREAIGGLL